MARKTEDEKTDMEKRGPAAFMLSVGFLMLWAKKWCTTYEMTNLIIFVLLFLIFIGLRLTASIIVK